MSIEAAAPGSPMPTNGGADSERHGQMPALHDTVSATPQTRHRASLEDASWRRAGRYSRHRLYPDAPRLLRPRVAAGHASSSSAVQCATLPGAQHGTPNSTTRRRREVRATPTRPHDHGPTCVAAESRTEARWWKPHSSALSVAPSAADSPTPARNAAGCLASEEQPRRGRVALAARPRHDHRGGGVP